MCSEPRNRVCKVSHASFVRPVKSTPIVSSSIPLPGLTAHLDKLVYHHGGKSLSEDKPHAFVYFITIRNAADRTVTLLGRKWVLMHPDARHIPRVRAVFEFIANALAASPRLAH